MATITLLRVDGVDSSAALAILTAALTGASPALLLTAATQPTA